MYQTFGADLPTENGNGTTEIETKAAKTDNIVKIWGAASDTLMDAFGLLKDDKPKTDAAGNTIIIPEGTTPPSRLPTWAIPAAVIGLGAMFLLRK